MTGLSTWVFRLRSGVTFHCGRRLRATDVVYSPNRVRGDETLQVGSYVRDVAQVEAVDELTVRIRTARASCSRI